MKPRALLATIALAAVFPASAAGDILRCVSRSGAVTYQQTPCGESEVSQPARIATDYPEVNQAARDRLFEREAALYQRLEAQRDRQVKELALRDAHEERRLEREAMVAAAQAAAAQQWVVARPLWRQRNVRSQPMPVLR
jgi:hypothetical protein